MADQAQIIRWEEPPPARTGGGRPTGSTTSRWTEVAEELRARPGRSAVIAESAGRTNADLCRRINRGLMHPFTPAGSFEATTRQEDGIVTTYVRYLGDGEGDR
jgi:hypothetical protein